MIIYIVTWTLAITLHINNIKVGRIQSTRDKLTEEIYKLIKICEESKEKIENISTEEIEFNPSSKQQKINKFEEKLAHIYMRMLTKSGEINSTSSKIIIETNSSEFNKLYSFNIEKDNINQVCYDLIEYIEKKSHEEIKGSFFRRNRYEIAGISFGTLTVYLFIEIIKSFTGHPS